MILMFGKNSFSVSICLPISFDALAGRFFLLTCGLAQPTTASPGKTPGHG